MRSPRAAARQRLTADGMAATLYAQLGRALAHLHQKADAFVTQFADTVRPALRPKDDAFRMLWQLLNYAPHKATAARLKHDSTSTST